MSVGRIFFGWKVVAAAFLVAVFGWGVSFYGPPVFLYVIHETRGWPVSLVSAAITSHYLAGALFVMNLPRFHRRFGVAAMTIAGSFLSGLGFLGWALASEPWQLFAATLPTGLGWAATGGAAVNAFVAPWFARRRPAALSMAYNGASVGGVVFSALWVVLIAALGLVGATLSVALAMVLCVSLLAVRILGKTPAEMGLQPDCGEAEQAGPAPPAPTNAALPGAALFRNRQFQSLAVGMSLGLFAQIGLLAHLYSLLVPTLGETAAGLALSYATACAIAGRTVFGWLMSPRSDRRIAGALSYGLQVLGCLAFLVSGGTDVTFLLLGVTLFGSGIGNAVSIPPLVAQVEFTSPDALRVISVIMGLSQAAFAFAPAVFGTLRELSPLEPLAGFSPTLFVVAGCIQLAAAAAHLIGRTRNQFAARPESR